ncbi:class Ib ribonucleoside-diphosphate reductase assembly flavoprotein NrdI [Pseudooceanicola sp. HF7]|uniref:class Ib ribonucleoside-diphosphate reductase assembly flavoprotein NrdI n=1 Tax=Pseudooceanicola sp. HF7 TaxID=2721560 RepID=UPI001430BB31|nr:class Ib ribonucleoside-diphosphate reductase assembly flavoprotein NrdI [Pseudooceanicola sp. HF7]NIZ08742.1 class Ib ribonucleoside-diphosphate reductase assembly flavoprotein NrdI [Pseudooceanicola sp. HF7]
MQLVYFSGGSGNTARMVGRLGLPATRLPRQADAVMPRIDRPFVLICPTYADGMGRHAVPRQVIRLLNDPHPRALLRGVIAGGNRNFGETFACAGDVISAKCGVPVLYRFELAGTDTDLSRIRSGLARFGAAQEDSQCLMQA